MATFALVQRVWKGSYNEGRGAKDEMWLIPMARVPDDVARQMNHANGTWDYEEYPEIAAFLETCGDCLVPDQVARLTGGAVIALVCQFYDY